MDERATRLMASIRAITAEIKSDPSWEGKFSLNRIETDSFITFPPTYITQNVMFCIPTL